MSDAVYMNGEVFTLSFPFISLTILSTIMEILIWEKKEKKKISQLAHTSKSQT